MKKILLLACAISLLFLGCIFDPNEAHRTQEGYYEWGFDAYTFWYNPISNITFDVSYMGKTYKLEPYMLMAGSPETRKVVFKIWEYDYDFQENLSEANLGEKSAERMVEPIGLSIGDFQVYTINLVEKGKAPEEEEILKTSTGEKPITLSISGGPRVDSERVWYPIGTQLEIVMYRGGCEFEPIYWTLE